MPRNPERDLLGIRFPLWGVTIGAAILLWVSLAMRQGAVVPRSAGTRLNSGGVPAAEIRMERSVVEIRRGARPSAIGSHEAIQIGAQPEAAVPMVVDLSPFDQSYTVSDLILLLGNAQAEVRGKAATSLGLLTFSASEAIPALELVAEHDSDEDVRRRAREALLNIRGYSAPARELIEPKAK